ALQVELGLYPEARQTYENFVHFAPLLEEEMRKWLDVQRCRTSYFCGDFAQSAEFAKSVGDEFHNKLAERLAQPTPETRRGPLPSRFWRSIAPTDPTRWCWCLKPAPPCSKGWNCSRARFTTNSIKSTMRWKLTTATLPRRCSANCRRKFPATR